MDYLKHCQ